MPERQFTVPDPDTLYSFEQLCYLIDSGNKTEVSDIPGTILVEDSNGNQKRYTREFNVSEEDKNGLEAQVGDFVLRTQNKNSTSIFEQQAYREESNILIAKIRAYVHCVPDKTRAVLSAYCEDCFTPAKISLRGKFVEGSCSECGKSLG